MINGIIYHPIFDHIWSHMAWKGVIMCTWNCQLTWNILLILPLFGCWELQFILMACLMKMTNECLVNYCIYLYEIWLKIKFLTRCCNVWPGWFIWIVFFVFSTFGAEICISSTACLVKMTNEYMENYFGCLLEIWFKLQFLISHGLVGHGCPLGKVLFMLSLVGCWDLHVTMRRTYGCT